MIRHSVQVALQGHSIKREEIPHELLDSTWKAFLVYRRRYLPPLLVQPLAVYTRRNALPVRRNPQRNVNSDQIDVFLCQRLDSLNEILQNTVIPLRSVRQAPLRKRQIHGSSTHLAHAVGSAEPKALIATHLHLAHLRHRELPDIVKVPHGRQLEDSRPLLLCQVVVGSKSVSGAEIKICMAEHRSHTHLGSSIRRNWRNSSSVAPSRTMGCSSLQPSVS